MKDLDFDELDKAVNSLMSRSGNAPVQPTQQPTTMPDTTVSQPQDKTSAPESAAPRPNSASSDQRPTSIPPRPAAPAPSLATKRSGRFMDVVHPSSDMTKAPLMNTSTTEKITLTPINTEVAPEPEPSEAAKESPVPTAAAETTATTPADKWPDPLEFHEQQSQNILPKQPVMNEPAASTAPTAEVEPEAPIVPTSVPSEPSLSPFIADAKVEKRPLGGTMTDDQAVSEPSAQTSVAEQKEVLTDQLVPNDDTQTTPKVELPAELHSDLLAVESDDAAKLPTTDATIPAAQPDAGPVSIAQQYKKQENSRDTSHTAMYDNAAQPLAHPAKKKSGWLGVVLIVVVILLLVGAAGAAYFMGYIPL